MHLLAARGGGLSDTHEPIDPNQTASDIIFISAADSELAALSQAYQTLAPAHSLRLYNLGWLSHPFSTDQYIAKTASKSRLVIIRALGGVSYWKNAIEQFNAHLTKAKVKLAFLPGDDKMDNELFSLSNVVSEDWYRLWEYLVEAGPVNSCRFLEKAISMLDNTSAPEAAQSLLRAGLYWPGQNHITDPEKLVETYWKADAPIAAIVFYRALIQGAGLHPINQIIKALTKRNINALPIFVASLKDPLSQETLNQLFAQFVPAIILNTTGFSITSPSAYEIGEKFNAIIAKTVLDKPDTVILQVVLSTQNQQKWEENTNPLEARDIAMNIALPEVDGRLLSRAVSFKDEAYFDDATQCAITTYRGLNDRVQFVADLAKNWIKLREKPPKHRRIAIILANYPNKDGRLANGVGLDTPASTFALLQTLKAAGFTISDMPHSSDALMQTLLKGPTNWLSDRILRTGGVCYNLGDYLAHYKNLPYTLREAIENRWGTPEKDPFVEKTNFRLSFLCFGNVAIGLQPARGYNIDPEKTYHAPDLVPPHGYLAFYFWARFDFQTDAFIHMGKHGNLEWLPGKALALSQNCLPEAVFGPQPHIYPFIVNDPGEGTQAKRRAQAVIIDHLTPPLTRAESYGVLRDLEMLVDEYYQAMGLDSKRTDFLRKEILARMSSTGIEADLNFTPGMDSDTRLSKLDAWLCEIKERQIRNGLHIFGRTPKGAFGRDLAIALARVPRGEGKGKDASLQRAIAHDFDLALDPLDCEMNASYKGKKPKALIDISQDIWRSNGDTLERIEAFACAMLDSKHPPPGASSQAVFDEITTRIIPAIHACAQSEQKGILTALAGRFVPPGPSGAPTRGRLDTLPTGRNFFSVDIRAIPTRTAWSLGWKSANLLIERFVQDNGDWPRTMTLSAWGSANMRTGGDDIAQALALIGARPVWDDISQRITGFEIIPENTLGRPRVDVTLRVSGFFRDAFPAQLDLFASAIKAVIDTDESAHQNPARAQFFAEQQCLGVDHAGFRIFGSKPGAYGAGLQAMIDEKLWTHRKDLADAYLAWGCYAYGLGQDGKPAEQAFSTRLAKTQAIIQNQDNHEHDILDSDDYYQFEGGLAASVEQLSGRAVEIYHNDHTRPERPIIRTLNEEMSRVVRARALNPKWIKGVMRHGYKGAFEIAATVDYLFAFAATTKAVKAHHFDLMADAYLMDERVYNFIKEKNPAALKEIAARFDEAIKRDMWRPKSNHIHDRIADILA